jgi:UDP-N-acetylmuramate dehydrogenase
LNGAEFLSAIPGGVGGALAMNAGAFGFEIWSLVESVTTINTLGEVFKRSPEIRKIERVLPVLHLHPLE